MYAGDINPMLIQFQKHGLKIAADTMSPMKMKFIPMLRCELIGAIRGLSALRDNKRARLKYLCCCEIRRAAVIVGGKIYNGEIINAAGCRRA